MVTAPLRLALALAGMAVLGAGCTCDRAGARGAEQRAAAADGPSAEAGTTPGGSGAAVTRDPGGVSRGAGEAHVLRASAQCGTQTRHGSARWLATDEEYRAALAAVGRARLPGMEREPAAVDFATHGVLLVEMGQRATAGYALDLANEHLERDGDGGTVRVNWNEPPEDAMVAQVLTSPCLFVAVKKDQLRSLKIVDQAGRTRETVKLR